VRFALMNCAIKLRWAIIPAFRDELINAIAMRKAGIINEA